MALHVYNEDHTCAVCGTVIPAGSRHSAIRPAEGGDAAHYCFPGCVSRLRSERSAQVPYFAHRPDTRTDRDEHDE